MLGILARNQSFSAVIHWPWKAVEENEKKVFLDLGSHLSQIIEEYELNVSLLY